MMPARMPFSSPPRNSTPCGSTVATMPWSRHTASMCWRNIRSAFLLPSGTWPYWKRSGWRGCQAGWPEESFSAVPQLMENGGLVRMRSKRSSSPPSTWRGSARVSSFSSQALLMPCSSMFILAMDQTVPLNSWPNRLALRPSSPCSSMYSLAAISMPPEPQQGS
ncbi:hypothetical protein D3C78_825690 [compost metagenome]